MPDSEVLFLLFPAACQPAAESVLLREGGESIDFGGFPGVGGDFVLFAVADHVRVPGSEDVVYKAAGRGYPSEPNGIM